MVSIEHLFAASIGLALFIIALLIGKRKKAFSDGIFLVWLFLFTLNFISLFLLNNRLGGYSFWELLLFEFSEASIFLHGPILYFYALALTQISVGFKPKNLLHFVPFVVAMCLLLGMLYLKMTNEDDVRNMLLVGKMLSLAIYILLTMKLLKEHNQKIVNIFSNTEKKHLSWLLILSWGLLIIWGISVVSLLVHRFTVLAIPQYGGLLTNFAFSVFFFVIAYFGIRQPAIFLETLKVNNNIVESVRQNKTEKYEKSGLSRELAELTHKELLNFMFHEKPFLDPELTLYSLSDKLSLQPNHLSQIINSIEGMNFFDFINQYRVEEVKKNMLLAQNKHLTILGVAYESGFNSKTSFNRIFKKFVGITPSEYKQSKNS